MSAPEPVTYLRSEDLLAEPVVPRPRLQGLGRRRRIAGLALTVFGLPLLTLLLTQVRSDMSLEGLVLLYLLAVVLAAAVGGLWVAVISAILAAFLINYYFVRPFHTLEVAQGEQALALAIFVIVAVIVSAAVEFAARQARATRRAVRRADALSQLAGPDLDQAEALDDVLERARDTFHMQSVALTHRERPSGTWLEVARAGWAPRQEEQPLRFDVPVGADLRLTGRGPGLFAEDQRVLQAFAAAAQTAFEGQRLSARARDADQLIDVDRQRTALLGAAGHDLRTPLAAIKAAVGTLRQTDVAWSAEDRAELLATIDQSADRLDAIVTNLLDASRLEAGELTAHTEPVDLGDVVAAALVAVPGARDQVSVDVPSDLPPVSADPGLLERVLANLFDNALRHGDGAVELSAARKSHTATLKVVDHGPGVPAGRREAMFEPFERAGAETAGGIGLGLTVARGFMEAMDGVLIADESPGGGLTLRLRLPLAP